MEIKGKIIEMLPMKGGTSSSGNDWSLKSFIIETQEEYPKKVAVEIFGDERIQKNPCEVDDFVTISFDLESREFNGKWYTSVRAYKVSQGVNEQHSNESEHQSAPAVKAPVPVSAPPQQDYEEQTSLPF